MGEEIKPVPLDPKGRLWAALTVLCLSLLWGMALYAYLTLPERVPTHFGWSGKPTAWGRKEVLLLIAAAFSLAPVSILLITRYRFTLLNRYPYLLNLPAFFSRIPREERGKWLNRYFEAILCLGFFLSLYLVVLEGGILLGMQTGELPGWFGPVALIAPFLMLIPWIRHLSQLYQEVQKKYPPAP